MRGAMTPFSLRTRSATDLASHVDALPTRNDSSHRAFRQIASSAAAAAVALPVRDPRKGRSIPDETSALQIAGLAGGTHHACRDRRIACRSHGKVRANVAASGVARRSASREVNSAPKRQPTETICGGCRSV